MPAVKRIHDLECPLTNPKTWLIIPFKTKAFFWRCKKNTVSTSNPPQKTANGEQWVCLGRTRNTHLHHKFLDRRLHLVELSSSKQGDTGYTHCSKLSQLALMAHIAYSL